MTSAPGQDTSSLRRSRRQIELYTLTSLDLLIVLFGLMLLVDVWARSPAWGMDEVAATAGAVALTVGCLAMAHRPRSRSRSRSTSTSGSRSRSGSAAGAAAGVRALAWAGPDRGWATGLGVLAALTTAVLVLRRSPDDLYAQGAGAYFSTFLPVIMAFSVISLTVPWRRLVPFALAAAVGTTVLFAVAGVDPVGLVVLAGYGTLAGLFGIATGGFTFWMLDVIRKLDDARSTTARLAVAEERLRFSRDLHDVYGRTLSAIAVKSELAAELAARGDERAVPEMRSVRTLAQESLTEIRGLVSGYREASLEAEIAGAAAMLRSTGARFEVVGLDGARAVLASPAQVALAWAVREAVTNIVRHSRARRVTLAARADPEQVTVTITNDGLEAPGPEVHPAGGRDWPRGHGLRGLAERVEAVGGSVESGRDGDRFTLVVRFPAGV